MEKIWRNMKEYEGIMKDSEEIWRKYEEIWINMWKYENKDSPYIWAMGLGKHRRHSSSQNYWLFPLLIRFVPFLIIIKNFLGKPNNKDHVSCFSIWGGGVGIFPSPKAYIEGENVYHYELTCWVLTARVATSPNARTFEAYCWKFTRRVWGLYGENRKVTARNRL